MGKKHFNIEKYKKNILDDLDTDQFVSVDNVDEEISFAKKAASYYLKRERELIFELQKQILI